MVILKFAGRVPSHERERSTPSPPETSRYTRGGFLEGTIGSYSRIGAVALPLRSPQRRHFRAYWSATSLPRF